MANRQHGRGRPGGSRRGSPARTPGVPEAPEPEVRRWPHPVLGDAPAQPPEPALHYIRCALSYQNQLLAEIKALLEQMAAEEDPG